MTIKQFLDVAYADDRYWVNVHREYKKLYGGYETDVPEELHDLQIQNVYMDWVDGGIDIQVN